MNHYQAHEWADYANGLVAEARRTAMEGHLDHCAKCRSTAVVFARLAEASLAPEPPPDLVARAEAIFQHPHPGVTLEFRLERGPIRARLLRDSAVARLAGTRRAEDATRRMLFEAGDYYVDVDLAEQPGERPGDPAKVVVVGQLIARDDPGQRLPGIEIALEDRAESVVARARSNSLGEFELACEARKARRLALPVNGGKIVVELPDDVR